MFRSDSVVEPASAVVSADDLLLDDLDALAQHRAEDAENRHGKEVHRRDQPVHRKRVHHHENDADERREEHVDRRRYQTLDVGAHFLKLAEGFTAALIFEDRIRQLERVADAVGIEFGAETLCDQVDVVVLKVLGHARDERHSDRGRQQQRHAAEELAGRVFGEASRVIVDDVPKDQRIEEGEHLVDGRQDQGKRD